MRPTERGPWRKVLRRTLRAERRHARPVRTTLGRRRRHELVIAELRARALGAAEAGI